MSDGGIWGEVIRRADSARRDQQAATDEVQGQYWAGVADALYEVARDVEPLSVAAAEVCSAYRAGMNGRTTGDNRAEAAGWERCAAGITALEQAVWGDSR